MPLASPMYSKALASVAVSVRCYRLQPDTGERISLSKSKEILSHSVI